MPRRTLTLLVLAVLATHLGLLEWWSRTQHGQGVLSAMAEPEFNRALLPSVAADAQSAQQTLAQATALAPPPPTVGQVVQARTLRTPANDVAAAPALGKPKPAPAKAKQAPSPTRTALLTPPASAPTPLADVATTAQPVSAQAAQRPPAAESPQPLAPAEPGADHDTPPPVTVTPGTGPQAVSAAMPPGQAPGKFEQNRQPALSNEQLSAIYSGNDANAWLNAWPLSTRLSYKLEGNYRGPLHGQAQVQWQRTAERYQAQILVNVGLFLDMRLTSQGRITPTRLWPQAYEEDRRGKKRGARLGEQTVVLDNGSTLPRPPLLQDTASQFVQLAQDFATGRLLLKVGAVVPVTLARPGGVDEWTYDVVALETLSTPLGPLAAYHLKPRPLEPPRSGVMAEMWFAPSLQHLPARIRLTLNAETWLDLALEKVVQSP